MWILPTRGRPDNLRRFLVAWRDTGAAGDLTVRLDGDDPALDAYLAVLDGKPPTWIVEVGDRVKLGDAQNAIAARHSLADFFGMLADDIVPRSFGWTRVLEDAAGRDRVAIGSDGVHPAVGGDLVRALGWLVLPGLDRLYADTVWLDIAGLAGRLRRTDAVLDHRHFSNGGAPIDATYAKPSAAADKAVYDAWIAAGGLIDAARKIRGEGAP